MKFTDTKKTVIQLFVMTAGLAFISPIIADPIPATNSNINQHVASYADAVSLAAPAVVSIKTTREVSMEMNPMFQDPFRFFFGNPNYGYQGNQPNIGQGMPMDPQNQLPKEVQKGIGSGVIVSDKGYILTNNHVVQDSDSIVVTLSDGRTADAKIVGTDPDSDLAILQIKLEKMPVIVTGSSQKLRVGDVVLAIGNPFGLDKTVTQGIISATERSGTDIGIMDNLLQTDAAINPGNSGGALIDAYGKLIGINTAIISGSGIGFAIPIDQAMDIMNQLVAGGHISRGYLGVSLQNLTQEIRDHIEYKDGEGVFVRAFVQNSPAQKAGLLPGDVITKINNTQVKDNRTAMRLVAGLTAGKSYSIEIFRKKENMTFTVTLGERNTPKAATKETNKETKQKG